MTDLVDRLRASARTKAILETKNRQFFATTTRPVACSPDHFPEWQAADRIEELERQLATMTSSRDGYAKQSRARQDNAWREALEEAAELVEKIAHDGLHGSMWEQKFRSAAAAIRALSDSTPTPLQEQKANSGKEVE